MTSDPNLPRDPNLCPDGTELRTTPEAARKSPGWAPWLAAKQAARRHSRKR